VGVMRESVDVVAREVKAILREVHGAPKYMGADGAQGQQPSAAS
jgi:hypothetical protein